MADHRTRRAFLAAGGLIAAGGAVSGAMPGDADAPRGPRTPEPRPRDAPNTPDITSDTIAEAEKIAALRFTEDEREQMLRSLRRRAEAYRQRREVDLPDGLLPAHVFDPRLPGRAPAVEPRLRSSVDAAGEPDPLPDDDADIAYAPVTTLATWLRARRLTSERLTRIYLDRLRRYGPVLECTVTLTEETALAQARQADAEIAAGRYRGPLHGVPWGAKDLLDTAGIRTTFGAAPYRERVPDRDAVVVTRLRDAGAVLVAKLTLGALAQGDRWYGGRTRNPWNTRQGSSGSSAGPAAATAAGLVGFSIGTETMGSIVSPCVRCGTTGLRPTFGRVPRTGAMALSWSMDKIGPICRTVEDCALVLHAIGGADPGDACSVDVPLDFDAMRPLRGMRVGWSPQYYRADDTRATDRRVVEVLQGAGVELVEVTLPERPYGIMRLILNVESAAAFEQLTLSDRDDLMERSTWPNSFRSARLVPAVELIQAERLRRLTMEMLADELDGLDAVLGRITGASMLQLTNFTGHPSLTLRTGFYERDGHRLPATTTLWGGLYEDGKLCRIGMALERELGAWDERPAIDGAPS